MAIINAISIKDTAKWLGLFYCMPKKPVSKQPLYCNISRCAYECFHDKKCNELLNSHAFIGFIKRFYAEAIWTHMKVPKKGKHVKIDSPMSDFSENFALWQLVYSAVDYIPALLEDTECSTQKLANLSEGSEAPWLTDAEFDKLMEGITDRIVQEQGWQPTIDFVWQNRTLEDYSDRNSRKKIDTHRQWHHTRTEVGAKMISIDAAQEQAAESGGSFELPDEKADPAEIIVRASDEAYEDAIGYHGWGQDGDYKDWLASQIREERRQVSPYSELLQTDYGRALCHEDRQLLALRNEEYTYKELAKVQNFSSHTGVINRLKHIEGCLEAEQPVSPRRKKLVPETVQIHRREKKVALLLSKPTLWYRHVYLCSPSAFTLCRHCLKKIDPGKWDFCCPHYQKNGICAASDLSYIYHLHSRPRKRRVHAVRDIKSFLPPPTEWWRV